MRIKKVLVSILIVIIILLVFKLIYELKDTAVDMRQPIMVFNDIMDLRAQFIIANETPDTVNHNDDSQNVHNSFVVKDIKTKYQRLLKLNSEFNKIPYELENCISADEWKQCLKEETFSQIQDLIKDNPKAYQALIELQKESTITGLSDSIVTDTWVLIQVWRRIQSIDNHISDLLKTSLVDQLNDSLEPGVEDETVVCVRGRVSRLLQLFTMVDPDPILSAPIMDDKELENRAYEDTYTIIQKELDSWPQKNIKILYDFPENTLSAEQINDLHNFETHVKLIIEYTLKKDYGKLFSAEELDRIIAAAQYGV